jgi:phospholipid transport system substrate-binding protein
MRRGFVAGHHVPASVLACLLALAAGTGVAATAPAQQLRGSIDRVIAILEDPRLKPAARAAERSAAIRKIADDIFDFNELAQRSLARHWRTLTDEQRREFVPLFSDLIERSYMSKIELYSGEPIQYLGERVDGDLATVATRIITKNGTEVPIDYRMLKRGDRWLVFDVSIEGVSLVANYRSQFNTIMQTASYAELVKKMRARVEELRASR